jgi:molybdopterin-guanine dinucleotide biosynthesis protein A
MGGGDKCLLELAGRPLLARVIERIGRQARPLLLSANGDPGRFTGFGLPVAADPLPGFPGPLAGILAGMRWAARQGAGHVLSLPTDTPFFPADLACRLLAAVDGERPVACAASGGSIHPVFAVWPVKLAAPLETALRAGERRVGSFAQRCGHAVVEWPTEPSDPFFNINTPDDLALARDRVDPT